MIQLFLLHITQETLIAKLLEDKNPEFHIVDELGTYYAAFNSKSKLFAGKTAAQAACMREAFSILIDREYICENIGQTGQVAANAFIPLGMADGNGGVFNGGVVRLAGGCCCGQSGKDVCGQL